MANATDSHEETEIADDRALIRIPEAAKRLSISRTSAYELAAQGRLPGVVRIGKSIRVATKAIDEFIDAQIAGPKSAA